MIAAATGTGHAAELVGVIAAALLAGAAILAPSVRARAAAMLAALAVAPVILVASIWGSGQLSFVHRHPALSAVAGALALCAVAALALVFHRRPALLPVLAVFTLPFRVPISSGGGTASLLVPLYGVIAAGVLAHAVPRLLGPDDDAPHPRRALEWLLAGYVVLYAVQSAWSDDFQKALQQIAFFYVPFMLLFCLLRDVRWSRRVLLACLGVLVGLSVIFVGIGFVEYARKEVFLNPKVIAANEIEDYFRVNSLFFDPNIYGRFLAMVMLALASAALWGRRGRDALIAGGLLALLWAGLLLTLSQSSFAALLAGLAVLAALRWSAWRTAAVTGAAVIAAAAFVGFAPSALHLHLHSRGAANRVTSGRASLVSGGLRLFGSAPIVGHGSASFATEYRRHERSSNARAVSASHTIPITVAAEQGVIGLAVYVALVIAALARLLRAARASPVRAYVAAAFVGLLVHTLLYAAFLEDPITWTLLGVGVALAVPALEEIVPRRWGPGRLPLGRPRPARTAVP